jgi:hypothetical protein
MRTEAVRVVTPRFSTAWQDLTLLSCSYLDPLTSLVILLCGTHARDRIRKADRARGSLAQTLRTKDIRVAVAALDQMAAATGAGLHVSIYSPGTPRITIGWSDEGTPRSSQLGKNVVVCHTTYGPRTSHCFRAFGRVTVTGCLVASRICWVVARNFIGSRGGGSKPQSESVFLVLGHLSPRISCTASSR